MSQEENNEQIQKEELKRQFFENELKLFTKYPYSESINELSVNELMSINTSKSNITIPHTSGKYQVKRFRKASCPIIERITNSLMYHGRNNGKKCLAIKIVKQALEIIALVKNKNPIRIVLDAVSLAGPREDSTRIGTGGTVKKTTVDVSHLRRINLGIYLIVSGAREASFRTSKNIAECLADELIACADGGNSYALRKKDEIERAAKANR